MSSLVRLLRLGWPTDGAPDRDDGARLFVGSWPLYWPPESNDVRLLIGCWAQP